MRRDELRILAPQRDAGLGNIHPDDRVSVRPMADESSHVVVEAAASRRLVEKFMVDDEAHVDSLDPAVFPFFVLEPLIQFGKLAVMEVSPCDDNAIDVAAGLVESVVGQRTPQINADKIPQEYRGEIGDYRLKKV